MPPIDDTTNSVQIQYTKTPTSSLKLDPSDITNKSGGTTTWCDALSGGSCPANLSEVTALRFKIPDMPKAGDEGSSRQVVLNMSNNANAQYGDIYKNKFQLLATTINPTTTNNLISNIVAISIADSTLPEIPVINTIDAKLATTNPITTDNTPEIKGTSESGTTLKVSTNNLTLCDNTTTPATGNIVYTNEGKNWSCIPSVLSDGNYQITALTKDNVNLASTSAPATFTVDTTAPTKPTIATPQVDQIVTTSSFVATGGFVAGGSDLDIVSVTIRDKVSTQTLCTNTTTVNTISLWTNCNLTNLTNGNYQIEAVATDNAGLTTISDPVNFVVNIPTDITIDELDSLNINCTTKEVNSTTSCNFLIPENKLLPTNFKLGISDGVISLPCVKESDPGSRLVNCTNVATGSVAGNQIIYAQIGEGTKTPTKDRVEITPPPSVDITPGNYNDVILVSNCTQNQTINIPQTYNCEFALKNTSTLPTYPTTYNIPSQTQIKAWTSTQTGNLEPLSASDSVCNLNQTKTALICNGIKTTNATAGLKNILITISTGNVSIDLAQTPQDKGDVTLAASPLEETILIPQSSITHTLDPVGGLKIYATTDYTLNLNEPRLVENSKTSVCTYKIKEVAAVNDDEIKGYSKLTSTILSPIADGLGQYDTTDQVFKINYNQTSGAGIKILATNQKFTDYNVQIRCTRSDGQQFATDQKINYKLGAYSIVTFQAAQVVD